MHSSSPRYLLAGLFIRSSSRQQATSSMSRLPRRFVARFMTPASHPRRAAVLVNVPKNEHSTTTTRSNGAYTFNGLPPGGPYTVTYAANGAAPAMKSGIYLAIGSTEEADFGSSEIVKMEKAVSVNEDKDTTFGAGAIGTATNFNADDIKQDRLGPPGHPGHHEFRSPGAQLDAERQQRLGVHADGHGPESPGQPLFPWTASPPPGQLSASTRTAMPACAARCPCPGSSPRPSSSTNMTSPTAATRRAIRN